MKDNIQWYAAQTPGKAIVLMVPGLNVVPSAMSALAQWLTAHHADVCLVKLTGHHAGSPDIKHVTEAAWKEDVEDGYNLASQAAAENSLPLFFVGYSLGALLGQDLMAFSALPVPFEKQILIAPATAIREPAHWVKNIFFFLNDKTMLPSFTPVGYRAHERLPVSAYRIMFAIEKRVIQAGFARLNIPTLIFIDPHDELISYRKLLKIVARFNLTQYEVVALDTDLKVRKAGKYHHLILNEQTMGTKNWEHAMRKMDTFLFKTGISKT